MTEDERGHPATESGRTPDLLCRIRSVTEVTHPCNAAHRRPQPHTVNLILPTASPCTGRWRTIRLRIEGPLSSTRSQRRVRFLDLRLVSFLLMLAFLPSGGAGRPAKESRLNPASMAFAPQALTPIGTTQLHGIIDAADLADLRWPKLCGTYRTEVRDFYDACDGSLPWMRESQTDSPGARNHPTSENC